MISKEKAYDFAKHWISSWNAHDIERIISHYDDDVEYFSTFVAKLTANPSGMLYGKEAVKDYFVKGIKAYPKLRFELQNIFTGTDSIILEYKSINDLLAAEMFELNDKGLAVRVRCHYLSVDNGPVA